MDREKIIVEMARKIQQGELRAQRDTSYHEDFNFDTVIEIGQQRLYGAKALYEDNYLKIPKGAVVLTKEELVEHDEKVRKETAKIFSELREFIKNRKHRFDLECNAAEETAKSYDKDDYGKEVFTKILHKKDAAWCECDVIESKIDNLVKKYGVEVL